MKLKTHFKGPPSSKPLLVGNEVKAIGYAEAVRRTIFSLGEWNGRDDYSAIGAWVSAQGYKELEEFTATSISEITSDSKTNRREKLLAAFFEGSNSVRLDCPLCCSGTASLIAMMILCDRCSQNVGGKEASAGSIGLGR